MVSANGDFTVEQHFVGKGGSVREAYDCLLERLGEIGPFTEDPKKTSIHVNRKSAFIGVYVRSKYLVLNIKADHEILSTRIRKSERVSANRFHHEVRVESTDDIDDELLGWLKSAYHLSD